jgi:hypothetical protein
MSLRHGINSGLGVGLTAATDYVIAKIILGIALISDR